jgi:predicted ATPase
VSKGQHKPLRFEMVLDNKKLAYEFGKDTTKKISTLENHCLPRESNSIFLPAKEVLSLHYIIKKTREDEKIFGFDNTYYELAQVLDRKKTQGNSKVFAKARQELKQHLGGQLEYDEKVNSWFFKQGNYRYPMGVTSEGIKKISILDTLLGNGYLSKGSVVFIDEPESGLHPKAIAKLLDIIYSLSTTGIQFFMATHSYFVIKKLYLLALKHQVSIPCLSINDDGSLQPSNFIEGMPDNAIIDESIELYKQSIGIES